MFVSLSKSIGKFGGFRIGIGKRVTSKNAWWLCLIICLVSVFQLMWYMMILCFWLMYAMFYGMWWCCKNLFQLIARAIKGNKSPTIGKPDHALDQLQANTYANNNYTEEADNASTSNDTQELRFCPKCGAELKPGNSFCTSCGNQVQQ